MSIEQPFIGRAGELATLDDRYAKPAGQLVLVTGRRRIGKTYLLERFASGKPAVFYQATRQSEALELDAFGRAVDAAIGGFPPGYRFASWGDALDYLAHYARGRLVAVLDEFPYLCTSTPGLASIVQNWWDRIGRNSGVMLVLCGSAQAFMSDLDASAAPLHQRFTAKLVVQPLGYREAGSFTPHLSPADRVRIYGILGGTPLYLEQWDERRSVRENLVALFADPASLLVDSAETVLATDIADSAASYRAVQAVALGSTRRNDILQTAKVTNERVLTRLVDLGLLRRRGPAGEPDARRAVYAVADPYFRFWFRFVSRARGAIDRGHGDRLIDEEILPELDDYLGPVFGEVARDFAHELMHRGDLPGTDVGSWWSADGRHEIDLVGTTKRTPVFVGEVKWSATPLDRRVLRALDDHAAALGVDDAVLRLLIGRGGVEASLARPGLRGYSIDDLYAEASASAHAPRPRRSRER